MLRNAYLVGLLVIGLGLGRAHAQTVPTLPHPRRRRANTVS
jgi:hypothetical protein